MRWSTLTDYAGVSILKDRLCLGELLTNCLCNLLLQLATKFRNSGQTCVCANRVLVQEGNW